MRHNSLQLELLLIAPPPILRPCLDSFRLMVPVQCRLVRQPFDCVTECGGGEHYKESITCIFVFCTYCVSVDVAVNCYGLDSHSFACFHYLSAIFRFVLTFARFFYPARDFASVCDENLLEWLEEQTLRAFLCLSTTTLSGFVLFDRRHSRKGVCKKVKGWSTNRRRYHFSLDHEQQSRSPKSRYDAE